MSRKFTFGDNSDKSSIFFFLNLVDRDLTEHQITQTMTLSRLTRNKLTGADKGKPTVHSHATS